jgi:hypothetical protein
MRSLWGSIEATGSFCQSLLVCRVQAGFIKGRIQIISEARAQVAVLDGMSHSVNSIPPSNAEQPG